MHYLFFSQGRVRYARVRSDGAKPRPTIPAVAAGPEPPSYNSTRSTRRRATERPPAATAAALRCHHSCCEPPPFAHLLHTPSHAPEPVAYTSPRPSGVRTPRHLRHAPGVRAMEEH